jgi:hypothetical protein
VITSHPFWEWFQANEGRIARSYENGDFEMLDSMLSNRVAQSAEGAGWEIGPYALPLNALVIAPGKRERVVACQELVKVAPALPGWRFFAGKPAKELRSLTVEVGGHTVCADHWRYRLTSYGGGEFVDLELFYEDHDSPAPADPQLASELLVEALVGETVALERVGLVESSVVAKIDAVDRATPLRYLKEHLNEVLAPLQ